MMAVINFLKGWAGLIGEVFGKYPLAGALLLAAAVVVFVYVQRERNPSNENTKSVVHAFLVLLGWLIAVPVVGFIFNAIGRITGTASGLLRFLLTRYERQPIVVLVTFALVALACAVWIWRAKKPRRPLLRVGAAVVVFIVAIALLVPLFDVFAPAAVETPTGVQSSESP